MDKVEIETASIQLVAYKKIVYHCLRYPSSKVYGAIVAEKSNPSNIMNAYPLSHTPIVNPTFGLALDLIESNLESN